jgi:hypothetical protein
MTSADPVALRIIASASHDMLVCCENEAYTKLLGDIQQLQHERDAMLAKLDAQM